MKDRIDLVADLLMGAAHADQQLLGHEAQAVRDLLGEILEDPALPPDLDKRLKAFNPKSFDVSATAAAFKNDAPDSKRRLLELVVAVHESDEELDLDEDDYLKKVAAALGIPASEIQDLALSVEVEDLREDLEQVRRG